MENFQNDCCLPWTKSHFKNSCSRQPEIVNAAVTLIGSRFGLVWFVNCIGQIDRPKSVFLQTKATHFETMMTTVNDVNTDKRKVLHEFIFRSVLLVCLTAELHE